MSYPTYGLTFETLRDANVERNDTSWPQCAMWTPTDWGCAAAGEMGEACNLLKKMLRGDTVPLRDVGYEIADVVIYLDLLAAKLNIDLGEAVRAKFNVVSKRVNSVVTL